MLDVIKSSTEISNLFKVGKRYNSYTLTLLVYKQVKQHDQKGRVAFIAGKKNGNAVWRNKAKRRLRAICRDCGGPWEGFDVVFIAKPSTTNAAYSKVQQACETLISRFLKEM